MILFLLALNSLVLILLTNKLGFSFVKTKLDYLISFLFIAVVQITLVSLLLAYVNLLKFEFMVILTIAFDAALIVISRYVLKIDRRRRSIQKLPIVDLRNLVSFVLIGIYITMFFSLSSWILPLQNDANSYTLSGIMIGDAEGLDIQNPYDGKTAENLKIDNRLSEESSIFNPDEEAYTLFGMPLFSIVVAATYQSFGVDAIKYIPLFFGILSIMAFSMLSAAFSRKSMFQVLTLLLLALNPMQIILQKKLFNESLTQFLLMIVLLLGIQSLRRRYSNAFTLILLMLLVSIRVEMIFIGILWLLIKIWDLELKTFAISFISLTIISAINWSYNSDYFQSDLFDRYASFIPISNTGLINGVFLGIAIITLVLTLAVRLAAEYGLHLTDKARPIQLLSSYFAKRKSYIRLQITNSMYDGTVNKMDLIARRLFIVIIALTVVFNTLRIFPFYGASDFSYDERLAAFYPIEFNNIENIILQRLGFFLTLVIVYGGLVGIILYFKRRARVDFVYALITFLLFLFLSTSQHDPNIIVWSRRYVYFVSPILILGFGYFLGWIFNKGIFSKLQLKLIGVLLILIMMLNSSFFLLNNEFSQVDEFLSDITTDEKLSEHLVLVDNSLDSSSISNLDVCHSLRIVEGMRCYTIDNPRFLPDEVVNSSEDIYLLSLSSNLGDEYFLHAEYILTLDSFLNAYFFIPEGNREQQNRVYVYQVNALPEPEVEDTDSNAYETPATKLAAST